ncbi:MAG: acyltransferase [Tepidisphaeraceae bacterium]
MSSTPGRRLPWDWHDGIVPDNVVLHAQSHLESSYSLTMYRSRAEVGLQLDAGAAAYTGTMFDVGSSGCISIGKCSMINVAWLICDRKIEIGDHVLISWNAVLMDSYRMPTDPKKRRGQLERMWRDKVETDESVEPRAIRIGNAAWLGFDCVILPGVSVGDGAIVGARSVVNQDVPPGCVVAGNPARIVRRLTMPGGAA